jgi:hypothetical protein
MSGNSRIHHLQLTGRIHEQERSLNNIDGDFNLEVSWSTGFSRLGSRVKETWPPQGKTPNMISKEILKFDLS